MDGFFDCVFSFFDFLYGKVGFNIVVNIGMCNMVFNFNGNVISVLLYRINIELFDMMEKNLGSVGIIGIIGIIGVNILLINFVYSLQWEFDKVYDCSFQLVDDYDDIFFVYSEVEMEEFVMDQSIDKMDLFDGMDDLCGFVLLL